VELDQGSGAADVRDAEHWRRIAYGSVTPFALLQSRKNAVSSFSKLQSSPSPYDLDWQVLNSFFSDNFYLFIKNVVN
jgi:nuclear pore complex protein Nup85